jgi:hypothetical protein
VTSSAAGSARTRPRLSVSSVTSTLTMRCDDRVGLDTTLIRSNVARASRQWLAVADLADEPGVGTGADPREALQEALMALGPRLASELSAGADLDGAPNLGRPSSPCGTPWRPSAQACERPC